MSPLLENEALTSFDLKNDILIPLYFRHKAKYPSHGSLNLLYSNPVVKTFRFHSGLAGDIAVQELMAEPKLCFAFPQVNIIILNR